MRSRIVLCLLGVGALLAAGPASAQHRQYQQHFQPHFVPQQHFQPHLVPHYGGPVYRGGGYYYSGGYVVQPSQPYCYDTNTGAFLHWGNCYGNSWDYGVAPQE